MSTKPRILVLAGLLFGTWLVYALGSGAPFTFDDEATLRGNFLAQYPPAELDHWRVASQSSSSGSLRRPVSMFTFYVNFAVSGEYSPRALKSINAAIHCIIAVLLYALFRRILAVASGCEAGVVDAASSRVSLLAAGIWLLHPLHVSTVLYSVQRMAQLSTLFVVLGLLVYITLRERWSRRGASGAEVLAGLLWFALVALLATFSKENGILLLWLTPLAEVTLFRGRWAGATVPWLKVLGWSSLVAPLFVIAAIFLLDPHTFSKGYLVRNFTMEERVLTQLRLLWRYAGWILWPNVFDMGFQHDDIPLSSGLLHPSITIIALLGWCAVLLLALVLRKREPVITLALLFFLIGHSLESGFLALEMAFEHRNYLPSIGLCLLLGVYISRATEKVSKQKATAIFCFLGLTLFSLLAARVYTWSDDLRLAQTNLARHPDSARSNYYYAHTLLRRYGQKDDLGFSEEQAKDYLLRGRHYYELMHQKDSQDIAALSMLYYLDSAYFPSLSEFANWLDPLVEAFEGRTLKNSDRNALVVLAECMGDGTCRSQRADVRRVQDALTRHYPGSVDPALFSYHYLVAAGGPADEKIAALKDIISRWPAAFNYYILLLAELNKVQSTAESYDLLTNWISLDFDRRYLPVLKSLFSKDTH